MPLTRWERKERLGHGAATEIAAKLGKSQSHVSRVLAGQRSDRKVEVVAARRLRVPVSEAFPEFYPKAAATQNSQEATTAT
ncbi:MAG: hypothetical protein M3P26_10520 [Gemmatimonadota bacterium]|nr:hypothetical protein [Gemmatimonadota bacterium]